MGLGRCIARLHQQPGEECAGCKERQMQLAPSRAQLLGQRCSRPWVVCRRTA